MLNDIQAAFIVNGIAKLAEGAAQLDISNQDLAGEMMAAGMALLTGLDMETSRDQMADIARKISGTPQRILNRAERRAQHSKQRKN